LSLLILTAAFMQITVNAPAATLPAPQQSPQSPDTIASTVDRQVAAVEKLVIDASEAMPDNKFDFSPESLNIPLCPQSLG
jgi:hypothetical protein